MKPIFLGSAAALVTPFTEREILWDSLSRLIEFHIRQGTNALVVCGTTGEPATMSPEEREAVIRFTVEQVGGRIPVIAGAGSNDTRKAAEAARRAGELGADAVLTATPYYNKSNDAGLVRHFHTVADAAGIPVIVYNVPSRTGVNITPSVLSLIAEHPMVAGIKEATGSIPQMMEMSEVCPDLPIYCGNDELNLAMLASGASGLISVAANIAPADCAKLAEAVNGGDLSTARALQRRLDPLIRALFCETSPIPVKTAMNLLGFDVGELRLPLAPPTKAHKALIALSLKEYGFSIPEVNA